MPVSDWFVVWTRPRAEKKVEGRLAAGVSLSTDVGRHFVRGAGHVAGAASARWVWRIRAEVRREAAGTLR
jgi:hypothetical protein